MAIERLLTLKIPAWRKVYFNSKRALIVSLMIVFLHFGLMIPVFFAKGPSMSLMANYSGWTEMKGYMSSELIQTMFKVQLFMYGIIPVCILVIVNGMLILETVKTRKTIERSKQMTSKRIMISISVAVTTVFFIIVNLPVIFVVNFLPLSFTQLNPIGNWIVKLFNLIQQINYCSCFTVLMLTNTLFRDEAKKLLQRLGNKNTKNAGNNSAKSKQSSNHNEKKTRI